MKFFFVFFLVLALVFLSGCSKKNLTSDKNENFSIQETKYYEVQEQVDVPILIYHQIRDYLPGDSVLVRQFIMPPKIFEEQIKYLSENGFETIYPNDLNLYFEGKKNLPEKPIILTFDDGTIGQYRNAFPVLKKNNFVATFYVFTHAMDKNKNYMSWGNLKEMSESGMDIGSHTYLHEYLNRVSLERAKNEIDRSYNDLKEHLNIDPVSFSYPFGEYDEKIINLVKERGYTTARSIINGQNHSSSSVFILRAYFAPNNLNSFKSIVE